LAQHDRFEGNRSAAMISMVSAEGIPRINVANGIEWLTLPMAFVGAKGLFSTVANPIDN
jgi:hypothetical protein